MPKKEGALLGHLIDPHFPTFQVQPSKEMYIKLQKALQDFQAQVREMNKCKQPLSRNQTNKSLYL